MNEKSIKYKYADIVGRMLDHKKLCISGEGERSLEFSSYDRSSTYNAETGEYVNWGANRDGSGFISMTDDGGKLIAEMEGAGYISRIWSALPEGGAVKIFIDGSDTPIIDMPFQDYFNGKVFPYNKLCYSSAKGWNCYVPITFARSCRVVAYEGWGRFYQINYTMLAEGSEVESISYPMTKEQASAVRRVNEFFKKSVGTNPCGYPDAVPERYTVTASRPIVKRLEGEGAISGITVRLPVLDGIENAAPEAVSLLKGLRVRVFWDGSTAPSVDAPLGDFFGSCYGVGGVKTLLYGIRDDKTLYNYYYMPYRKGAEIEISSTLTCETELELSVNSVPLEDVGDEPLYFNAFFHRGSYSDVPDRFPDFIFLKAKGRGRFVGLNLHIYKSNSIKLAKEIAGYNWWGEGDEKIFVDGEKFPSWFGTGTEDFFGYAWCCPALFSETYHAQAYCVGGSQNRGNRSYTRMMMADSIPFDTEFEGCIEKYYPGEIVRYGYTPCFYLDRSGTAEKEECTFDQYVDYFKPDENQ